MLCVALACTGILLTPILCCYDRTAFFVLCSACCLALQLSLNHAWRFFEANCSFVLCFYRALAVFALLDVYVVDFLYALREGTFEGLYSSFRCVVHYGCIVQGRPIRLDQLRQLLPCQSKRCNTSLVSYGCTLSLNLPFTCANPMYVYSCSRYICMLCWLVLCHRTVAVLKQPNYQRIMICLIVVLQPFYLHICQCVLVD